MAFRRHKKRPLIGVSGPDRGGHPAWVFTRLALRRAGAQACRLTPSRPEPPAPLQGLIIGGGDDIDPKRYGQEAKLTIRINRQRDQLEWRLLEQAAENSLPILGICRGAQLLNIFYGGTLHQHLMEVIDNLILRRTVLPHKRIRIDPQSHLAKVMGTGEVRVNSLHHQGVDHLAEGFCISARDDYDIVQAIECVDHPFMMGVQWHPEYLPQSYTHQRIFSALVRATRLSS